MLVPERQHQVYYAYLLGTSNHEVQWFFWVKFEERYFSKADFLLQIPMVIFVVQSWIRFVLSMVLRTCTASTLLSEDQ